MPWDPDYGRQPKQLLVALGVGLVGVVDLTDTGQRGRGGEGQRRERVERGERGRGGEEEGGEGERGREGREYRFLSLTHRPHYTRILQKLYIKFSWSSHLLPVVDWYMDPVWVSHGMAELVAEGGREK